MDMQFYAGLKKTSPINGNRLTPKKSSELATGPHDNPHINTDTLLSAFHKAAPNCSLFIIVPFPPTNR
jgi:hypothetical protein